MAEVTPRLCGSSVVLREPIAADADGRRACGHQPEIIRMYGGSPAVATPQPMTAEEAQTWFATFVETDRPYRWVIEHGGRIVGTARLHSLVREDRRARYAIGLFHPDFLGRGVGTEATKLVLQFAFRQLGLHRIDLRVLAHNERAIRCYRTCGFVEEGRERETALIDGIWHDDIIMGMLEDEFAE